MNKKTRIFISSFVCICLLCAVCVTAGSVLISPAIEEIEKHITLKKCTVVNDNISFSSSDFDDSFCMKSEFIKLESLPDTSLGVLKLESLDLFENQIIARDDFDKIVFCPRENVSGYTEFSFCNATTKQSQVSVSCIINVLEEINLAPCAVSQKISTGTNISAFKFLKATDPEYDELSFEVVSYPAHGSVTISDDSSGYFCYKPESGYSGKDSFVYMVTDKYGNKSEKAKVEINVAKIASDIVFSDLEGHWACNSAVKTASKGLMEGVYDTETGAYNFNPGDAISRGDFLAMALISAGKESEISFVTETSFADNDSIPMNIRSYAEYALVSGIVNGHVTDDGKRVFASNEPLTRAQAAVIVNNILKLPDTDNDITVFADSASIPDWAGSAVANLTSCGIFNGTGYGEIRPESIVTRAEAAEILCNIDDFFKK